MTDTFLNAADLATLTGRKRAPAQIAALRHMGIPYWVNAAGRPVVARAAIEGRPLDGPAGAVESWRPDVLRMSA